MHEKCMTRKFITMQLSAVHVMLSLAGSSILVSITMRLLIAQALPAADGSSGTMQARPCARSPSGLSNGPNKGVQTIYKMLSYALIF